jgi:hypothetical protein
LCGLSKRASPSKGVGKANSIRQGDHIFGTKKRWITWLARETSFGGRLDIEKKQWFSLTVTEFEFSLGVLDAYTNNERRIEG